MKIPKKYKDKEVQENIALINNVVGTALEYFNHKANKKMLFDLGQFAIKGTINNEDHRTKVLQDISTLSDNLGSYHNNEYELILMAERLKKLYEYITIAPIGMSLVNKETFKTDEESAYFYETVLNLLNKPFDIKFLTKKEVPEDEAIYEEFSALLGLVSLDNDISLRIYYNKDAVECRLEHYHTGYTGHMHLTYDYIDAILLLYKNNKDLAISILDKKVKRHYDKIFEVIIEDITFRS